MTGKVLTTCIATAIAYVLLEMGLHGGLLSGLYQQTASVWRSQEEMKNLFPLMILGQVLFGIFYGLIYTRGFEVGKGTLSQGFRYGLLTALMLGPMSGLVWYVILPIPQNLAFFWSAGCFVQMTVLGLVAGAVYKK